MNVLSRNIRVLTQIALVLFTLGLASIAHAQAPGIPQNTEADPQGTTGAPPIEVVWDAVSGATSYRINRSATSSGSETFYGTLTTNSFLDSNVVAGPPQVYYYTVQAVNASGTSAVSAETAAPTPLVTSKYDGTTTGVAVTGGTRYYAEYALLNNFDWFVTLNGWFPQILGSSGSIAPGQLVIDMAYTGDGQLTFSKVNVPTAGLYNIDWRYGFASGLFPGVNNREESLWINGVEVATNQRFIITGSFDVYTDSTLQEHLNVGDNTVMMQNITDHGVSRVDALTITPATSSVPSGPTNLNGLAGNGQVSLAWTASTGANSYNVYDGTKSDGEAVAPVASVPNGTTTYTVTGLTNGKLYFFNVAAVNATGTSQDFNEISVTPVASGPPPVPGGVSASAGNAQVTVSWNASAGATSYNLFRATTSGGEGTTAYKTGVTSPFTDTGLTNGVTYYYTVDAVNANGASAQSAQVSATPSNLMNQPVDINCGGAAASPFAADEDFTGGTASSTTATINTSLLTAPIPPQAVLQTNRHGTMTYTVGGFTAGSTRSVTLYFEEHYWTAAGKRVFNVSINGTQALTNFDIFAAAGAQFKGVQKTFSTTANSSGQVVISFTAVTDQPIVNGIAVS